MKDYWVYILTNKSNKVLYIGVTSDIEQRIYQHHHGITKGFTHKYNVHKFIYYEHFSDPENAILREKQLKKWSRSKKEWLINQMNPEWKDLSYLLNL